VLVLHTVELITSVHAKQLLLSCDWYIHVGILYGFKFKSFQQLED